MPEPVESKTCRGAGSMNMCFLTRKFSQASRIWEIHAAEAAGRKAARRFSQGNEITSHLSTVRSSQGFLDLLCAYVQSGCTDSLQVINVFAPVTPIIRGSEDTIWSDRSLGTSTTMAILLRNLSSSELLLTLIRYPNMCNSLHLPASAP